MGVVRGKVDRERGRPWLQNLPGHAANGEWEFPSWTGSAPQHGTVLPAGEGLNRGRGKHIPRCLRPRSGHGYEDRKDWCSGQGGSDRRAKV